jgi:excinuclease ABC subunit A
MPAGDIIIRGARTHNLKNIDVTIPRDKFVVITGLSGSGKSSLAFDTIYAEGQRRYIESLSAYARQFLEQMDKPDVDLIEGLSPAISIEQRTTSRNPRSTVGTSTEIYDYLRLLFARVGRPHCFKCGRPIAAQTISQMVDQILELPEGAKITILAPVVRGRKGEYSKELAKLAKTGFIRAIVDGEMKELGQPIELDKKKKHNIDLVVDRLTVKSQIKTRLADSLETALHYGDGLVKVSIHDMRSTIYDELLLSEKHACVYCQISYPEITPQLFSFNSPKGACHDCDGLGTRQYFDPDLIIPNKNLSLREGAIVPWQTKTSTHYIHICEALAKHYGFDIYTPYNKLPENIQNAIIYGSGEEKIKFFYEDGGRRHNYNARFDGVIPQLERRWRETTSDYVREDIERFMNFRACPTCNGTRLRKESLHVLVGGKNIAEITSFSIRDALKFFSALELTKKEQTIASRILKEIKERLGFLSDVGLDYLTLNRASATLAGGEDQRIRLATQIGSALTGVLYVLDEPSIGLHQRDNDRLLSTLIKLRDLGNTVLVVEHDRETILSADHIIDLGPGAGVKGGYVVATGTPKQIIENSESLTGLYLAGKKILETPKHRRTSSDKITIVGAREHNLKNITVDIPLGILTCITGVSGSGKSTLINETLCRGLMQRIYRSKEPAGLVDDIIGVEKLDKVINIDQSPIGRTPRSNPATYTGVFTFIRGLFSELPQSRARGYKPGRFSFNVKGGRCEACEGDGVIRIEMHFMPDVYVECEVCRGRRFNRETLEIEYKGSSIADVLSMTVNQAHRFFENIPAVRHKLETLLDVGLGYLELGQSATTLSGGEAQRIKLSRELSRHETGRTLYILDEPTTGLHFDDVAKLLNVLNRLVERGNTVIVIEHNLDVIKSADYCIDLGPEGGDGGGKVVARGTPEELAQNEHSYTGKYLKKALKEP